MQAAASKDQHRQAAKVLDTILYASVATADENGQPWNSPVFIVFDEDRTCYWASALQSQHSQNIRKTGRAFLTVYDSTVAWGEGIGVYLKGSARELSDEAVIDKVKRLRAQKVPATSAATEHFTEACPRRLYGFVIEEAWINSTEEAQGSPIDKRLVLDMTIVQKERVR